MHSLGIDIGYSAVKMAVLDADKAIIHSEYALHHGNVAGTLSAMLGRINALPHTGRPRYGAVTGSGSAFLSDTGETRQVNEVAALVEGALLLENACVSIIEMGGRTAKFITGFTPEDKSRVEVSMTSNCSSGTGSFLEEQVSRLGMDIEDYSVQAAKATFVPRIAGRCSVFAKTDIIHHQQEGVAVADILAGLAHAVVKNYRSAVIRRLPKQTPILFVGGVCRNSAITEAMASVLQLSPQELRVNTYSDIAGAVGAAALAAQHEMAMDFQKAAAALATGPTHHIHLQEDLRLSPLQGFGKDDGGNKHTPRPLAETGTVDCWLGIDVGSTSTNLVLVDERNEIIGYRYLRTGGDPVKAVRAGLAELHAAFGGNIRVAGAAATGSGRYMTGRMIGADVIRDEITAQARAAVAIDPAVDTVFEIGGQDSKFIALEDGVVIDFQMNKICAAGTGSFIEEQAKKLGVRLEEIGPTALSGEHPASLGERCTVFMESSIAAHMACGVSVADLAAGLCYSIVKNYMNRVVGQKRIGNRIFLQGGVGHNQGVVNAFRAVTGAKVTVPFFFSVTGAYGAAILAREEMQASGKTTTQFKGFAPPLPETDPSDAAPAPLHGSAFNNAVRNFIFADYDPTRIPGQKTVGIPRALFTYGMFPMFYPFFRELGCNLLLSEPTSEETIRKAQEYSLDETCYPVKLINGHAAELVEKGVDYLFFPDLYTVFHPGSKARQNFGCAYMQLAFKIINKAMDLENKGITLLAPTIAFSQGGEFMKSVFMNMGRQLGKTEQETGKALQAAMGSFKAFEKKIEQRGKDSLAGLDPDQKTFVLISKVYGVADPVLNLGIPDKLAKMGYRTLPFYDMPEVDIFQEHPNMYWPFGQHILEAGKLVAAHPNLYAVFLTHHGCGPDTVTAHYFKEIMGDKPYLTIEVDEHSSGVGVVTRVEAFVNSLGRRPVKEAGPLETYTEMPPAPLVDIRTDAASSVKETLILPRLYPYSALACKLMQARGLDVIQADETTAASIDLGRKHTVTNEYYSLTAMLGSLLQTLQRSNGSGKQLSLLLPQNEGAEVDGQYARFIRNKLDENGLAGVAIVSPFMEDLLRLDANMARTILLCLLAGDLVLLAPREHRKLLMEDLEEIIGNNALTVEALCTLSRLVRTLLENQDSRKTVFALGEPMTLYCDILNDNTFKKIETAGHRVVYAPLSEYLWSFWHDHAQAANGNGMSKKRILDDFRKIFAILSEILGKYSHFEPDLEHTMKQADKGVGLYAGAFGRYRNAKPTGKLSDVRGIISVTSMYENTGISLDILQRNNGMDLLPTLTLTFDGARNDNDKTKTESFIHYL